MADCSPFFLPGQDPTCHVNVAVTGCRFVSVLAGVNEVDSQPRVGPTGAAGRAFGVAARDKAVGQKVMVFRSGVVPVEAGLALAHGQEVESDALGRAVPLGTSAGNALSQGTVLADAAAGAQAKIALKLGA